MIAAPPEYIPFHILSMMGGAASRSRGSGTVREGCNSSHIGAGEYPWRLSECQFRRRATGTTATAVSEAFCWMAYSTHSEAR